MTANYEEPVLLPRRHWARMSAAVCLLALFGSPAVHAKRCNSPSQEEIRKIELVLKSQTSTSGMGDVSLIQSVFDEKGCYTKLRFGMPDGRKIDRFLTPDHHFLTESLIDLRGDATWQATEAAARVRRMLLDSASPSRGAPDASVTLVEFGDFECPFCAMFALWMGDLPHSEQDAIRTVYKYLPLPQHPWAKAAAEIADCANQRSASLFWRLHDFYLTHQGEISIANIKSESRGVLAQGSKSDADWVMSCVDDGEGRASVQRDMQLAEELNIHSTPAVVMDGTVFHVASREELENMLRGAQSIQASRR